VIVELGTTTRAGKAVQFAAMFPRKVTICTVFPCENIVCKNIIFNQCKMLTYKSHFIGEDAMLMIPPIIAEPIEAINLLSSSIYGPIQKTLGDIPGMA
jgi:hypothetical protein